MKHAFLIITIILFLNGGCTQVGDTNNSSNDYSATVSLESTGIITQSDTSITYTVSVDNAPKSDLNVTLSNGLVVVISTGQLTGSKQLQITFTDYPLVDGYGSIKESIVSTDGGGYTKSVIDTNYSETVLIDTTIAVAAGYTMNGTILYEDKEYSSSGFTGVTNNKAVRYATLEIVDSNDSVLATTRTNNLGQYNFSSVSLYQKLPYRLRVKAESINNGYTVTVKNYTSSTYSSSTTFTPSIDKTVSTDLVVPVSSIAGAFNLLDISMAGYEYLDATIPNAIDTNWKSLDLFWQSGYSTYGTYTCETYFYGDCGLGKGVYVLGGYDSDEFDDDVILHEFGHVIEMSLGISDSPGGFHDYTDDGLDMRLSWSEGFASAMHLIIKKWIKSSQPSILSMQNLTKETLYVDTKGSSAGSIDFMVDFCKTCIHSSNEIAIAKVVWQMDNLIGDSNFMNILANYIKVRYTAGNEIRINSEVFWNGLLNTMLPTTTELTSYKNIFKERLINYYDDQYESNDTSANYLARNCTTTLPSNNCFTVNRNLYYDPLSRTGDKDMVKVSLSTGKTYVIETTNLLNGADTNLNLYDTSMNLLVDHTTQSSADDLLYYNTSTCSYIYQSVSSGACLVNNGLNMRSKITYSPTYSGEYLIEVTSTPDPVPALFAGDYGDYTLSVSVQ